MSETAEPRKPEVLIIDDEVQIRRLLRVTLETGGFTVRDCDCGQVGLSELAFRRPDIVVLDLRGISTFTDFFVICSGASEPQLKAIASGITDQLLAEHNLKPNAVDGYPLSQWVVVDYGSVVVHIFPQTKRDLYLLEDLWSDAPRLDLSALDAPRRA